MDTTLISGSETYVILTNIFAKLRNHLDHPIFYIYPTILPPFIHDEIQLLAITFYMQRCIFIMESVDCLCWYLRLIVDPQKKISIRSSLERTKSMGGTTIFRRKSVGTAIGMFHDKHIQSKVLGPFYRCFRMCKLCLLNNIHMSLRSLYSGMAQG